MGEEPNNNKSPLVAIIEQIGNVVVALLSGKTAMTAIICATLLVGWFAVLLEGAERTEFINKGGAAKLLESLASKFLSSALIPVSGWLAAGVVSAACYALHRAQHWRIQAQGKELARLRDKHDPKRVSSRRLAPEDGPEGTTVAAPQPPSERADD